MKKEKVIQFGEGGFLRGFADWMLQHVNEKTNFSGSAVVIQPIPEGFCHVLTAQNCTYTHICRGAEGVETKKIDVISRCINPYTDFNSYLKLAENPDFRFVISNTTEAGITYYAGDKPEDRPPVSFPAKVTLLLKRRFDLGLSGFIFLPCELIEKNGETLREIILRYGAEWSFGEEFIAWVQTDNIFCNTLVDRIVTGYPKNEKIDLGYTDKMLNTSEYFHLWVIEGYPELFRELPLDQAGLNVVLTDDLTMYRERKVRILNGAHTCLVPYALLQGYDTVKSCMDDEGMLQYIKKCIFDEIIPTLDLPAQELTDYAAGVLQRFANPYIRHYLSSIALNSISKFRVRVLPSILEYIRRFEKMPETLLFAFAKLIEFYRRGTPSDDPAVMEFMRCAETEQILASAGLWGTDLRFLTDEVNKYADQ